MVLLNPVVKLGWCVRAAVDGSKRALDVLVHVALSVSVSGVVCSLLIGWSLEGHPFYYTLSPPNGLVGYSYPPIWMLAIVFLVSLVTVLFVVDVLVPDESEKVEILFEDY